MSTADVVAELRRQAEVARTIEHPRLMARVLDQRADQLEAESARARPRLRVNHDPRIELTPCASHGVARDGFSAMGAQISCPACVEAMSTRGQIVRRGDDDWDLACPDHPPVPGADGRPVYVPAFGCATCAALPR